MKRDAAGAAGAGGRRRQVQAVAAVAAAALVATSLQGCDVPHVAGYMIATNFDIKTHKVAEWRTRQNYWDFYSYQDPDTGEERFNSCMDTTLSVLEVCSGHGICAPFDPSEVEHPVLFCKCADEWGGVECRTKRKRQSIAWFISLLFGPLALDELYLGMQTEALSKLLITIAGCGIAASNFGAGCALVGASWLFDVVRIGTGPVLTKTYRVQEDLPRISFAIFTILYFSFLAFLVAVASMYWTVIKRRRHYDQMLSYTSYGSVKNAM